MTSVIGKRLGGRTYYYAVETARERGAPRIVSQRYLGSAERIMAAVDAAAPSAPTASSRLPFGDVAAVWRTLCRLDLAGLVDALLPGRRGSSPGTLLAVAVLHRVVAGGGDLASWWRRDDIGRVVRGRGSPRGEVSARQLARSLRLLTSPRVTRLETELRARVDAEFGLRGPVLALDLPEVIGSGLLVAVDGAVPLAAASYSGLDAVDGAGRADDVTDDGGGAGRDLTFSAVMTRLAARHEGVAGGDSLTVVLEPGRMAQLDLVASRRMPFIGSLPLTDFPELLALPSSAFHAVDRARLPGVTAVDTRARVLGADRRVVLVRSESARAAAERGFAAALRAATRQLDELAEALADGSVAARRGDVAMELARITSTRRVDRVLSTSLTLPAAASGTSARPRRGEADRARLTWRVDQAAYGRLRRGVFGRQLLVTDRNDWPLADVLLAYRARARLAGTFDLFASAARTRDGDPVPEPAGSGTLVDVLAVMVTHLMRREAQRAGLDLSARDLLDQLAGITETRLRYPSTGGRPPSRRLLDTRTPVQQRLFELFGLDHHAPRAR